MRFFLSILIPALAGTAAEPGPPASSLPPVLPEVFFAVPILSSDTLEGIGRAKALIAHRYRSAGNSASARGNRMARTLDRYCSWEEGAICHGGDPDLGECNANVPCHPDEESFAEGLLKEALAYPTSGFLMGQAVYALTKFDRLPMAQEAVDACQAEDWWCEALQGYVLYAFAPLVEVEASFRSALANAPDGIRCRWEDATWLLGEWDQRVGGRELLPPGREEAGDWDCASRLAVSDSLWWMADPLFSEEGNDRWTTHIARAVAGHLSEELRSTVRGSGLPEEVRDYEWAMRVRRGPWDSYERLPGRDAARFWTSEDAARYHFLPEVRPGDLARPTWRLQGEIVDEGYTPDYGPLFPIQAQIARFRNGDSLRVVAAGDLNGSPLRRALDARSHLVLVDSPEGAPIQVTLDSRRTTPVLLEDAPPGRYLAAIEVVTDIGIGIHRQFLSPLSPEGPEISDLLLYEPSEETEPEGLLDVTPLVLGSPRLEEGAPLGVFWEAYGAPEGETLTFELTMEREEGGLVDRLAGLFPGGSREDRGRDSTPGGSL
ncbi:MAG: hypothetical protein ACWGSQ_10090 [Longimicrobiales bacterium]